MQMGEGRWQRAGFYESISPGEGNSKGVQLNAPTRLTIKKSPER